MFYSLGFSSLDFGIEIVFFFTVLLFCIDYYFGIDVFKTASWVNKKQNKRKNETIETEK